MLQSLSFEMCWRMTDIDALSFETTAELSSSTDIIGQPRGARAIEFGIGIESHGYNIFVLGATGTGRATAIERFVQHCAQDRTTPDDWVYVHNFTVPHKPRAITLPSGEGVVFKQRMVRLIQDLQADLPKAFDTDTYRESIDAIRSELEMNQNQLLQRMSAQATQAGFALARTPSGFTIVPVQNGEQMTPQQVQQLPVGERQQLQQQQQALADELEATLAKIYDVEQQARTRMKQIDREVAEAAVQHYFEDLQSHYEDQEEVLLYLAEVHQDVLHQIDDFTSPVSEPEQIDLRRYEVNLLVDNGHLDGAPVILETNPSYHGIFGRLEYEMQNGLLTTHFTNIKCGSLHHANGGYLIINAHDLLKQPRAWEALKRALKSEQIRVGPLARLESNQVLAKSLEPEPIPLDVKIILMGHSNLYYSLHERDLDFGTLFKVRADFQRRMPRTPENEQAYATFIATRCHEEELRHFDKMAVAQVIEFGSRLAEHQEKLSTLFGAVADLVREASYWAGRNGRDVVTAADVRQALEERTQRANRTEENIYEYILDGSIFIATEGAVVGQVNGLSVIDTGEYTFGQPGRITARTFTGDAGVVHIERETDMSGPIHQKGVLTLTGYLGGTYARRHPLSLSASLTFEQNYVGVEGDSASSAELYALLSSLSEVPIKQSIAVTGSVNQRGEVQPIGGVNEKVEGFFRLCHKRGLSGDQGVIIPASNVFNLMLHPDVLAAIRDGQFHIWAITTIDEGIEILTGIPAGERDENGRYSDGSIHHTVQNRLLQLAKDLDKYDEDDEDD